MVGHVTETSSRLDPRTVPRGRLIDRLGRRRPDISIVALVDGPVGERLVTLRAAANDCPQGGQFILARCAGAELSVGHAAGLCRAGSETLVEFANRAAGPAVGRLLVLLPPGTGECAGLRQLLDRFAAETWLGAVDPGGRGDPLSGLVTSESLWTALGGLETSYLQWDWAIRDYCRRARAIGYSAPVWSPGAESDSPDARLFAERAALAPDRSAAVLPAAPRRIGRFTVYTAITDRYDTLKPQPAAALEGCEQLAFLDQATASAQSGRSRGWQIAVGEFPAGDPHRAARFAKINAHLVLPDSEYSLWIDASIGVACPFPLGRLAELFLVDSDLCLFRHHARRSIYEEAAVCRDHRLDRPEVIDAQVARYRAEGLPEEAGLVEAPVILRRHTGAVRAFNEAWWSELVRGSRRDQLSFNYVAWKLGLSHAQFPLTLATRNGLFVKFLRKGE